MIPGARRKGIRAGRGNVGGERLRAGDKLKHKRSAADPELEPAMGGAIVVRAYYFLIAGRGGWTDDGFQSERCLSAVADIQNAHREKVHTVAAAVVPLKNPV